MKTVIAICIALLLGTLGVSGQDPMVSSDYQAVTEKRNTVRKQIKTDQLDEISFGRIGSDDEYAFVSIEEEEQLLLIKGEYSLFFEKILFNIPYVHERSNWAIQNNKALKRDSLLNQYIYTRRIAFDSLSVELREYFESHKLEIQIKISNSDLTFEEQDFLDLYLLFHNIRVEFKNRGLKEQHVAQSKSFLKSYPESRFTLFVQKYFIMESEPGQWGLGFDFGPCTGAFFLSASAERKISPGCFANIGFIISYKKLHYMVRVGGLSGSIRETFVSNPGWKKGRTFNSGYGEMTVGYELIFSKFINIIPVITAGATSFASGSDDPPERLGTSTYFTWGTGLALDLKLNQKSKFWIPGEEYLVQYWYLRILAKIYPGYFQAPFDMTGNMYVLSFNIGGLYRPPSRKHR